MNLFLFAALAAAASLTPIEDNYAAAKTEARKCGKMVLVDLWAPWCHSCLSMKNYVLKDPILAPLQKSFVLASIDTERAANKTIVDALAPTVLPTFLVIDPKTDQVLARLPGSATASAFLAFVGSTQNADLVRADQLLSAGKHDDAYPLYQRVAADQSASAAVRGRAAYSASLLAMSGGDMPACVRINQALLPAATGTFYEAAIWSTLAFCALATKSASPELLRTVEAKLVEAIRSPTLGLSIDDKSDLTDTLAEMRDALGDTTGAIVARQDRLRMLEDAAKAAPDEESARTFDAHRSELYIALKRYDEAIAMLTHSEKIAPKDYNPPARLARVYLAQGDTARARLAIERAKAKVYGPRTAVILLLDGDIAQKSGDKAGAKKALSAARQIVEAERPTLGRQRRLQHIDKSLSDL